MDKGLLIVISGPSGAGKGTIYNSILERMPEIGKSVSVTTRAPRPGEIDGVHYHFKTESEYQKMVEYDEFLEYADVHSGKYGTPKKPVLDKIANGGSVMLEIDVKGARNIKRIYPDCVTIFIMPPSFEVLEQRLRGRNTETEDKIRLRLKNARDEIASYDMFDYVVFNDKLNEAIDRTVSIIRAEMSKTQRNIDQIKQLLAFKEE